MSKRNAKSMKPTTPLPPADRSADQRGSRTSAATDTSRRAEWRVPEAPPRRRAPWVILIAAVAVVGVVLLLWQPWSGSGSDDGAASRDADAAAVQESLGENPYLLGSEASDGPVLVEFLDFQCPACAAVKPVIDQMRQQYAGDVTFAVRMLPLDGHANAVPAALAAAAADEQGEFEPMYDRLFQDQAQWAGQADPEATFRGYAEEIGLDMEQYDTDVASSEVADRVEADRQAAVDLGVTSTPSFFLNGEAIQIGSPEELVQLLDDATSE